MAEKRRSEPFIENADRFPSDDRRRRPPSSEQDARRKRIQQRRRRNSVFQYIAVLFMAAFVLLLFTFMMERRQSQQQIDDLKQSASATQTLQGLLDENAKLKDEIDDSEKQSKDLADQLAAARAETAGKDDQIQSLEKSIEAMHWFWQINDASVRGRTALCRQLIASMEEAKLQDYLPKENITGTDRFSPYDRYMEIRGKVIR